MSKSFIYRMLMGAVALNDFEKAVLAEAYLPGFGAEFYILQNTTSTALWTTINLHNKTHPGRPDLRGTVIEGNYGLSNRVAVVRRNGGTDEDIKEAVRAYLVRSFTVAA